VAETAQYLMEHGHTWSEIISYPPHLLGRMIVATHRIDDRRTKEQALISWIGSHADYKGLQSFMKNVHSKEDKKNDEITPEESRKAAIGLMNVLSGLR